MEKFQKTVLFVAIILLILFLIFIGITLSSKNENQLWPPVSSVCPDYWITDASAAQCFPNPNSGKNKGKTSAPSNFDINSQTYTGVNGLCNKWKWANENGIEWDGLTYGVTNPCMIKT